MNIKRNLDKKKKEEYISLFKKQANVSDEELKGLCRVYKQKNSVNGTYKAILLWQLDALKLKLKEEMNGESTS